MNNFDILKQIAVKMDNQSLVNLFLALNLPTQRARSLIDSSYWKERTEYLVGCSLSSRPQANWRDIHCSLNSAALPSRQAVRDLGLHAFTTGLANGLDVLLVMFEVYGEPKPDPEGNRHMLPSIRGRGVLSYLIEQGHIKYDSERAINHLKSSLNLGNIELVSDILKHVDQEVLHNNRRVYLLSATKYIDTFKLLCNTLSYDRYDLVSAFVRAAENGHIKTIEFIFETIDLYNHELVIASNNATDECKPATLSFILNNGNLSLATWAQLFKRASKANSYDCAILLYDRVQQHIKPDQWRGWLFKGLKSSMDDRLFDLLLQNTILIQDDVAKIARIMQRAGEQPNLLSYSS